MGGSIFTWIVIGMIIFSAVKSSKKEKDGKVAPAHRPGAGRRPDGHGPYRRSASTRPGMPRPQAAGGIPPQSDPDIPSIREIHDIKDIREWWDHKLDELTQNADRQYADSPEGMTDGSHEHAGQDAALYNLDTPENLNSLDNLDTIGPEEGVRTTTSSGKPAGTAELGHIPSIDAADFTTIHEERTKGKSAMEIDPEKLIIYSEIMKPKFDM